MKFLNLKFLVIVGGIVWVGFSFFLFAKSLAIRSADKQAVKNIELSNVSLLQKSEDLKFKLGQWAYNYHLVKTKGLDFDQETFLKSEFESIYFFKLSQNEFEPQWVKSKDIGAGNIPSLLQSKLKNLSKEELYKHNFIYFSENLNSKGSKVFFGFPIMDSTMGQGVLFGALDLDYVQLLSPKFNVYVIDSLGRFLFHPKKEYIGQSASGWLRLKNKNITTLVTSSPVIGGDLVYRARLESIWAQVLGPTIIMLLGLFLVFGFLIFETIMQAPLVIKNLGESTNVKNDDRQNEIVKDSYGAIMKLDEIRDSLNKMSLLSSVISGRLGLASMGEIDKKLFQDIKNDFSSLDSMLEKTYRSSQSLDKEVGDEADGVYEIASKTDLELKENKIIDKELKVLDSEIKKEVISVNEMDGNLDFSLANEAGEIFERENEGVVFQEYIGDTLESNDWAKIIEELTEEINTVEINKPSKDMNLSE